MGFGHQSSLRIGMMKTNTDLKVATQESSYEVSGSVLGRGSHLGGVDPLKKRRLMSPEELHVESYIKKMKL